MFYQGDKSSCSDEKNIIKQEPNIPNNNLKVSPNEKLEYTTLIHSNLTPPSSASSTSSTSSNGSNKKYQNNNNNNNNFMTTQASNSKRKLSEHKTSSNMYNQKPIYSEYLSSKCLLYIYYKVNFNFI